MTRAQKRLFLALVGSSLSLAPSMTFAQEQMSGDPDAATEDTTSAPASTSLAPQGESPGESAPQAGVAAPSSSVDWQKAMQLFDLGLRKEALATLRQQVMACGTAGQACTERELATLFVCVAIALATDGDHHGAVQAFKKAATHDPMIGIASEYRTAPVMAAHREAEGIARPISLEEEPARASQGTAKSTSQPIGPLAQDSGEPFGQRLDKGLILVTGSSKVAMASSIYGPDPLAVAKTGVGLTLAGNPAGESGFAVGFRTHGGGYFSEGDPLGYLGGAVMIGSIIGPREGNRFGYFFGGGGMEYFPAVAETMAAFHFIGGGSIGGFAIGGAVDLGINSYGSVVALGLELGWGGQLQRN